jgi:hypothetical protein
MFEIDYDARQHCDCHLDDEVCCTCNHMHPAWIECPASDISTCGDYRCCQP